MLILLTLFILAVNATIFNNQVPEQFMPQAQMVAIALPTLLLILQMLKLGKNRATKVEKTGSDKEQAPQQAAAREISETESNEAAVVQFLARLQEKGRLLDFLMDDIAAYDNESVGAAARIVHQGCCEVLHESFSIETVYAGEEMDTLSLADNYDSQVYRLTGNVPDSAPYEGRVLHRGWKTTRVNLPQLVISAENLGNARTIIAPAEIEID